MRTAKEWIYTFPPQNSGGPLISVALNEAQIELIQADAQDDLKKQLGVARELLEDNADGYVDNLTVWRADVQTFLSTFKEK